MFLEEIEINFVARKCGQNECWGLHEEIGLYIYFIRRWDIGYIQNVQNSNIEKYIEIW